MSFDGHSFTYGGTPYNLQFLHIKTSYQDTAVESSPKYETVRFNGSSKFFLKNRRYEDVVEYDVELISAEPISIENQRNIVKHLFNSPIYKKLKITSLDYTDMEYQDVFFNCIFTDETKIVFGDRFHGWKCKMICDAPYAWMEDASTTNTSFGVDGIFTYTNTSDEMEPVIPKLILKAAAAGTIKLQNTTTEITLIVDNMTANEVLTIDKYGQMDSSMGYHHYSDWNKSMMKLANGTNSLIVTNLSSVSISHELVRRVGI